MIVCPRCDHLNQEDAVTCASCGGVLEGYVYRACPSCGALNPAQSTFCNHCLSALMPSEAGESDANAVEPFDPIAPLLSLPRKGREAHADQPSQPTPAEHPSTEPSVHSEHSSQPEASPHPKPDSSAPRQPLPQTSGPDQSRTLAEYSRFMLETAADPIGGIEGLVSARPIARMSHEPTFTYFREPGPEQQREAALFGRIATTAAPLRAVGQVLLPKRGHTPSGPMRLVLYLLVLSAALFPSFSGGITSSHIQPRPAVAQVSRTIDELPADAVVLVAFDYDLTYAGEINALALTLARQLAARSIRAVVIGTTPSSLAIADQIYRTVSEETTSYRYGEDYLLLGYLPGQDAGLRTLAVGLEHAFRVDYRDNRALEEWEPFGNVRTPDHFARIILLADDERSVRGWIEQIASRFSTPLAVMVSTQVEPLLVPYQQSGQISSLVAGATWAIDHEVSAGLEPSAGQRSDGYAALFGIIVLVAIITNIVYITRNGRNEGMAL